MFVYKGYRLRKVMQEREIQMFLSTITFRARLLSFLGSKDFSGKIFQFISYYRLSERPLPPWTHGTCTASQGAPLAMDTLDRQVMLHLHNGWIHWNP